MKTVLYIFSVIGMLLGLAAGAVLGILFCDAPGATARDCMINGQSVGVPLALIMGLFPVMMAYCLGRKGTAAQTVFYLCSALLIVAGFPVGSIMGLLAVLQHRKIVMRNKGKNEHQTP
jgi:hypothetical protein